MYIKGIKCRKSKTIGFRMAIEGDKDIDGNQVDNNYVSFVKIKDCPVIDGYYNPDSISVKCISVNHGATNYGYGKPKMKLNQPARWIEKHSTSVYSVCVTSWIETPFYAVYDAQVYVGNIRKEVPSKILLKLEREKKLKRILDETV